MRNTPVPVAPFAGAKQILVPIPLTVADSPSPRRVGLVVRKRRSILARRDSDGGMANRICGTQMVRQDGLSGYFGNETLTKGVLHAQGLADLQTW